MSEDKNLPFQLIAVGEPFGDRTIVGIGTRATFDFYTALGQLLIYIDNPSDIEIESIKNGRMKLGMARIGEVLFLTWQFYITEKRGKKTEENRVLAFDTSYNIHLSLKDFEFAIPEEGMGYGVQIVLIDSSSRIVKAIRVIGTSKEWSDDFRKNGEKDRMNFFNKELYSKFVDHIYREFSIDDIISLCKIYDIKWKR